jgi:hypothetical protein
LPRDRGNQMSALIRRLSRVAFVPIALVVLMAGCDNSSSAGARKTSFCADNAKLAKATASAKTLGDVLRDLRANQSTVDDFGKKAPSAIKAQAQFLVTATQAAIRSDSTGAFGTRKFADAGRAVGDYCGQPVRGNSKS